MFTKIIAVLETLADRPQGATVGVIAACNFSMGLSRGQWQRVIDDLVSEGFVFCELQPYGRTGKRVYLIAECAIDYCCYVSRAYEESGR